MTSHKVTYYKVIQQDMIEHNIALNNINKHFTTWCNMMLHNKSRNAITYIVISHDMKS